MLLRRAAPVMCGAAACGAAGLVWAFDPSAPDSRFPPCTFRAMTGLWCPGCGLTRGFHELFHGHVAAALGQNLFVPIVLVAAVVGWWSWTRSAWGRPGISLPTAWRRPIVALLPILIVVYGVVRNIPHAPFDALAP